MIDLTCPITEVAALIPHSGEMVLLDAITEVDSEHLIAETYLRADNLLVRNGQLSTFMGAEILAQGIAAWAGYQCVRAGKPIGLGYWLGSRRLTQHQPFIPVGTALRIRVKLSIEDASGFGVFDCELVEAESDNVLLDGALNVFRPRHSEEQA